MPPVRRGMMVNVKGSDIFVRCVTVVERDVGGHRLIYEEHSDAGSQTRFEAVQVQEI
jgi:hypothetical protein